ncbi:hypothetical protein EYF80_015892 [Liparis tanakae]|uniref:Uncharacterized protein n=1 Tax=Liparis tanakae TaxID=230148 RepID=A0A4Z2I8Y9_9TELE|nr:hypothetical protein EYF80_015892 [Liparis tanakae]
MSAWFGPFGSNFKTSPRAFVIATVWSCSPEGRPEPRLGSGVKRVPLVCNRSTTRTSETHGVRLNRTAGGVAAWRRSRGELES